MTALATTTVEPQRPTAQTIRDEFVAMAREELSAGHSIREVTKTVHARTPHLPAFQRDVWWCELKHSLAARDLAEANLAPWYDNGVRWDTRIGQALEALTGGAR